MSQDRVPDDMIEVHIAALTESIDRIERPWANARRQTDLSKALRRQRGAWKLYRLGVFDAPPRKIGTPLILSCAPCPQMDDTEIDECLTQQKPTTRHSAQSVSDPLTAPSEDETMLMPT